MDYKRKIRWSSYHSHKCKMYLRNDFHFECAYCRMRESDAGIMGEDAFEKDHFVSRMTKNTNIDLDGYSNMVYACSKCNGTKSNQESELLLDLCKDDIYSGLNPHITRLGEEGDYQLKGNTAEGKRFIKCMKLNSYFYREMRRKQWESEKTKIELRKLVDELYNNKNLTLDLKKELNDHIDRIMGCIILSVNPEEDKYRCGTSFGGEAFR